LRGGNIPLKERGEATAGRQGLLPGRVAAEAEENDKIEVDAAFQENRTPSKVRVSAARRSARPRRNASGKSIISGTTYE
jgi:hypothetical protein